MSSESGPNWERLQELLDISKAARRRGHFDYSYFFRDERVHSLVDHANAPHTLNEKDWCNTTACFAGHAVSHWENILWDHREDGSIGLLWGPFGEVAGGILGLNELEQNWLFCSFPDGACVRATEMELGFDKALGEYRKRTNKSLDDIGFEYLEYSIDIREFQRPDKYLDMRLKALKESS